MDQNPCGTVRAATPTVADANAPASAATQVAMLVDRPDPDAAFVASASSSPAIMDAASPTMRDLADRLFAILQQDPGIFVVTGANPSDTAAFAALLAWKLREAGYPVFRGKARGSALYDVMAEITLLLTRESGAAPLPPVVLRDDADDLSLPALQDLGLLFEKGLDSRYGFRAVLIGRPVLRDRLGHPSLWAVKRRVRFCESLREQAVDEAAERPRTSLRTPALLAAALVMLLIPIGLRDEGARRIGSADVVSAGMVSAEQQIAARPPAPAAPGPAVPSEAAPESAAPPPAAEQTPPAAAPVASAAPTPQASASASRAAPTSAVAPPRAHSASRRSARPVPSPAPPPLPETQLATRAPAPEDPAPAAAPLVPVPVSTAPAAPEPQCEPYTAAVNYAAHAKSVRGMACRDANGRWWLVDQKAE